MAGVDGRSDQLHPRLPLCPLRQDQLRVVDDRMSRAPRLAAATAAEPAPARQRWPPTIKPNGKSETEIGGGARRRLACAWKTP